MIEEAIGLLQFDSTLEEAMYTDEFYKELVDWLKELMELRKNNHRWIPVSERLPEDEKYKLVWLSSGRFTIMRYNKRILWSSGKPMGWGCDAKHYNVYFETENVVAWMPLPEPYKEVE